MSIEGQLAQAEHAAMMLDWTYDAMADDLRDELPLAPLTASAHYCSKCSKMGDHDTETCPDLQPARDEVSATEKGN